MISLINSTKIILWPLLAILLFNTPTIAQKKSNIKYEDYIYQPNIRSTQITINGVPTATPIILLNSGTYFVLHFDDLEESEKDYYYKIIHCDKDWNPSEIAEIEYLDGFNDEPMRDWEFSLNTLVNYTHYWLSLPNRNTKFKISGNYLLYVYQRDLGKEIPLITKRLMVSEQNVNVVSKFVKPTISSDIMYKQQLELNVSLGKYKMLNPQRDLYVSIIQNGNFKLSLNNIEPRFITQDIASYDVFGGLSFDALNEFRSFDTRSINTVGFGLRSIEKKKDGTDAYIFDDKRRNSKVYGFTFDFNGKYYIDNVDFSTSIALQQILNKGTSRDSLLQNFKSNDILDNGVVQVKEKDLRADYIDVYFTLKSENELPGDVYIYGGLTDWQIYPRFKMEYNLVRQEYTCHALLKQGYYDYYYAHVNNGEMTLKDLEGSWEETENDYLIIAYSREFGSRYDKILGFKYVNSLNEAYFKN